MLGLVFLFLVGAGLQLIPLWKQPYPESAYRQAIVAAAVVLGWTLGLAPACAAIARREAGWVLGLGLYTAVAGAAVWMVVRGQSVIPPYGRKPEPYVEDYYYHRPQP